MKVAFFQAHRFEREFFDEAIQGTSHSLTYQETRLTDKTAVLAQGHQAVCSFVNDQVDAPTIRKLQALGVQVIALRTAGFNHVDLHEAASVGIPVVRVPAYSPHSVAEHAVCLLLAINRKVHRAYQRIQSLNFSLDGLVGFDLHGKSIGVVGTGEIGSCFAHILRGFGCHILAYDRVPNPELESLSNVTYVELDRLLRESDVISLHVPLTPDTHHLIDATAISQMKPNVVLLNTGRGALIDTKALIAALKTGQIGGAGLDVYEEEEQVFFQDLSEHILQDDLLARLMTFPNVLITSHQGFLTKEALRNIAHTTIQNLEDFEQGRPLTNQVLPDRMQ